MFDQIRGWVCLGLPKQAKYLNFEVKCQAKFVEFCNVSII